MAEVSLDLIGISEGTDKHSLQHDYLRHYERMFEPFRDAEIDIIEIGVAQGASLRTWRRFFSRARIVGIDIHPDCRRHADESRGVIVEIGSQDDPGFLMRLCQLYRPSIIIDDGSHLANHIQFSFERLFPALLPGGCYVFEDFLFHFGQSAADFTGSATTRLPEYLAGLAFGLLGESLDQGASGLEMYFNGWIDRIEIIGRASAIWKKPKLALAESEIVLIEEALHRAGRNAGWGWYCGTLIRAGLLERAEFAANRAIELQLDDWSLHARLAEARELRGDLNGALRAIEHALTAVTDAGVIDYFRGQQALLKQRGAT